MLQNNPVAAHPNPTKQAAVNCPNQQGSCNEKLPLLRRGIVTRNVFDKHNVFIETQLRTVELLVLKVGPQNL